MIDNVEKLRNETLEEIERNNRRNADLQTFLRVLDEKTVLEDEPASKGKPEIAFSTAQEIATAVRQVLTVNPGPMHISKLYEALLTMGLRISGQNPKANLSAKLSPYDDIIYIKDQGWKLTEFRPKDTPQHTSGLAAQVFGGGQIAAEEGVKSTDPRQTATPNRTTVHG